MSLESRRERAERMLLDAAAVMPLPLHKLIERHNHALAAVRALWVSRRKWRAVAEQQAADLAAARALHSGAEHWISLQDDELRHLRAKVAELEEDNAHLLNAQHDAQLGGAQ